MARAFLDAVMAGFSELVYTVEGGGVSEIGSFLELWGSWRKMVGDIQF